MAPSVAELPIIQGITTTKSASVQSVKHEPTILTRAELEDGIRAKELVPLWAAPVTQPEPRTKHIPAVWKYADTKPLLLKAGEMVDPKEAERRALLHINPGPKQSPFTLDTILSAHQLLLPGEKAICHRHTPFAVRFLIEGEKGYTAIAGKKMYMQPGDLIITPSMEWHDHGNDGKSNVIWLDGLNIPFFKLNPIDFLDLHEDLVGTTTHASKVVTDEECAEMKFPWTKTKPQLDASKEDHVVYEYRRPDGKHVNSIVAASAEKIAASKSTASRQDTVNRIYQVHSGRGTAKVSRFAGEPEYNLAWGPGDTFCVPSWYRFTIHADKEDAVYLFSLSDKAMLEALNLYRAKV